MRRPRSRPGRSGLCAAAVVAALVLGPLLVRSGQVQTYDMVFVPRPALDRSLLGLGGGLPRAVPSDLLVALASRVLPAGLVQRLALAAVLVLAAWGAARLLDALRPGAGPWPGAVAAVVAVWTPGTYERLVLGQWALLLSTAALPWVVLGALRLREQGRWVPLVPALVLAACGSPAGLLLVAAVATVSVAWRCGAARGLQVAALAAVLALPWLLPSLLAPGGGTSDPGGLAAFAPREDLAGGPLGSLLLLGGVWNAEVEPPGGGPLRVLLLAVVVAGAAVALVRERPAALRPLAACAAAGVLLALVPLVPGLDAVGRAAVRDVPGAGLLRDGQKLAAPYALLVALGAGLAAARLLPRLADDAARRATAAVLLLLPLAATPALAWGAGGRLQPVRLPAEAGRLDALVQTAPGAVVSLPWSAYRRPAWNGGRTVLDPVPRLVGRPVVVSDDLRLGDGTTVQGEDPLAAELDPLLAGDGPLTAALAERGAGWAVVARGEAGADAVLARLPGAEPVLQGGAYVLLRLPGVRPVPAAGPPVLPVVLGDLLVLAVLAGTAVRWRRRTA